jgi:hypothetical protein
MKKRVKALLTIRVSLTPGRCRWCGCTYHTPCEQGCGWADRAQTLCTECVPLDHALQTARGRKALAEFVQINFEGDLGLLENPDDAVPRRTSQTSQT